MSEQPTAERVMQITHELREYGNEIAFGYGLDRATALEAAAALESLQRERVERDTPKPAVRRIATKRTKDPAGCGIFGIGTKIWFCPKCGMFNTPSHKYCWECGQALSFDTSSEPKGEDA